MKKYYVVFDVTMKMRSQIVHWTDYLITKAEDITEDVIGEWEKTMEARHEAIVGTNKNIIIMSAMVVNWKTID